MLVSSISTNHLTNPRRRELLDPSNPTVVLLRLRFIKLLLQAVNEYCLYLCPILVTLPLFANMRGIAPSLLIP